MITCEETHPARGAYLATRHDVDGAAGLTMWQYLLVTARVRG